ncbi:MAG: caspase family protein [Candidatus Aminicenantes bacterium]|nr:caspase family protein [Candidatus Aminicenantes bacterium]
MKEKKGSLNAVIVGVDGYKDAPPLQCAVNDAVYLTETLQKVWQNRGTHIKTLVWPSLNQEKTRAQRVTWGIDLPPNACPVTREGLLSAVRESAGKTGETDTFIFFFAGHGELVDAEPALITVAEGETAEGIEKIKIKEIQQAAAGCPARNKIMILDCCQTSPGRKKSKQEEKYKNLGELTKGWSIFLSSSPGESSLEDRYFGNSSDDYLQQGIFTASLAVGLRGEAAGGSRYISLADLAYYVGKRVPIEYQERLEAIMLREAGTGKAPPGQPETRGTGSLSQSPVLLSEAVAMNGPYKITMAPEIIPACQDSRTKTPGKNFIKNWFKFLWGQWPIVFPFKTVFRLASLLYAAAMTLTVIWHSPAETNDTLVIFYGAVGLGSVLIWWLTLPFAAAANEERWHSGGYVTLLFYLLWHCLVALVFAWLCGVVPITNRESNRFIFLVTDLFFILAGIVIFAINTSQTIISLAETVRPDERREIRQAIRVFEQFKSKMVGVDLYNYVAAVSVRPNLYIYGWIVSAAVIGFNIYQVLATVDIVTVYLWTFLVRNIFLLVLVTWLVFWYHAAFKTIQKEVYKR